jgi:tungstate transport system substrate-binding protein
VLAVQHLSPAAGEKLIVATTTSLFDTGFCDELRAELENRCGVKVYFISVGTGLALEHAKRGDADAILVHAPALERGFLQEGHGVIRRIFAYNFFAIVGPADDPAGIRGLPPLDAMVRIADAGRSGSIAWISRGDKSGTHVREMELWEATGLDPVELRGEPWFIESGMGMGKTLMMANEKEAYTLSDLGTYLRYRSNGLISLEALVMEGKELLNVYSVIVTNPALNPDANFIARTRTQYLLPG